MTRPSARHVPPGFPGPAEPGNGAWERSARLLEERIVLLGTRLDDASANDVAARLTHLAHRDPDRDISLYINSPGGSFTAMTAVHDTMRFVGCDVETVCPGRAGPSAAVLLAAGTPGRRLALPGARVVLRQPAPPGPLEGRADDVVARARELTRARTRTRELPVRHTGRRPEQVRGDIERETVLDARQALEYGLVDRVVAGHGATSTEPGDR
ncbi:ATP-dependent Clp protease proteolytic subunit [Streptomyces sp. NPDC005574]|uniref:ATP-dependent Clp protease proteolytic subunit n=1 Tax=Streptomyces sp. NPDC005574 TaxID=3156891 RepID=UPI0033A53EC2